jgi:thiol-disulfide isomerase/thioredoxin
MMCRVALGALVLLFALPLRAAESTSEEAADEPTAGERLIAASGEHPTENLHSLAFEFDGKLVEPSDEADRLASELLEAAHTLVSQRQVVELLNELADERPVTAARLLLQVVHASAIAKSYDNAAIVVGQLVVDDGKLDAADVLAQMPILDDGYFAGEIGDAERPLCFRAAGYEDLNVPMPAPVDGVSFLGKATLKPLAQERRASLRGKVVLDNAGAEAVANVTISISMGDINTPHNGFSGRMSWPAGLTVDVDENGEFSASGLNPSKCIVSVVAPEHVSVQRTLSLPPGEEFDAGEIRLFSSDLGFYVGHEPPETPELAWEPDYATALKKAEAENRPLLVMMTATWCGPCKMLEQESLNDPWIRHFLAPFVMVQAFEDQDIEKTYGLGGYPTLAFCDSAGELVHKHIGYVPPSSFAAECVKALEALHAELPAELQLLVEKGIVTVD